MEYQQLVDTINEKKSSGQPYYDDIVRLENTLSGLEIEHRVKAQLYHCLALDYLQHNDEARMQDCVARALESIKRAVTEERLDRDGRAQMMQLKTRTLLLEVGMSSNAFVHFMQLVIYYDAHALSAKELLSFCLGRIAEYQFMDIVLRYATEPCDLRAVVQRVCEQRLPASVLFLRLLATLARMSTREMKGHAVVSLFMLDNRFPVARERPQSARRPKAAASRKGARGDVHAPCMTGWEEQLVYALATSDALLRFAIVNLAKRGDTRRAAWLLHYIESRKYLFEPKTIKLARAAKKFVYLHALQPAEALDLADIIAEIARFLAKKEDYRSVYSMYQRYGECMPSDVLFPVFVRLNMLESAAILYDEYAKEKSETAQALQKEHVFEYLLKIKDVAGAERMLFALPTPRECLEYLRIVYKHFDSACLVTLTKTVAVRFHSLSGSLKLVVLSLLHQCHAPATDQLDIFVLLAPDGLSENQRDWLCSALFNLLMDLQDLAHPAAYKAVLMLCELGESSDEAVHLFLSMLNEQHQETNEQLEEQYFRYIKRREAQSNHDSGSQYVYHGSPIFRRNMLLFLEQFQRAGLKELATTVYLRLLATDLTDGELLLFVRISHSPGAYMRAVERGIVSDSRAAELVSSLLQRGPLALYVFLSGIDTATLRDFKGAISLIRSNIARLEPVCDDAMLAEIRSLISTNGWLYRIE
ncbi:hypothetical protein PAPHI01_1606 [Pancytospora philotis]|nr:hypothetical protein PAPHI01_1606 [Pancytospora philotis]